jgi:low temperature requirement protein LtrA
VQTALDADSTFVDLATVVAGGLLIVFALWWIYFDLPSDRLVERARREIDEHGSTAFVWGYGHYVVFGAAAAAGAGLAVAVEQATDHSGLTDLQAGLAVTVPVVVFVMAAWLLHYRDKPPGPLRSYLPPLASAVILLCSVTPEPVLATGLVLAGVVGLSVALTPGTPADAIGADGSAAESATRA